MSEGARPWGQEAWCHEWNLPMNAVFRSSTVLLRGLVVQPLHGLLDSAPSRLWTFGLLNPFQVLPPVRRGKRGEAGIQSVVLERLTEIMGNVVHGNDFEWRVLLGPLRN